jgi:hypothetical protein
MMFLKAAYLASFAVHGAGLDGCETDPARAAINSELFASIAANGVREPITLHIDTARNMARLDNGNHRAVMACAIDPEMLIPVNIKVSSNLKRALGGAKPYSAE